MKITVEYKGEQVTFDVPDEKLDELVKEQKQTGWEKPTIREAYWYIDEGGAVFHDTWWNCVADANKDRCGNCFTSKHLAENMDRYQSLDRRIRRRIAEICEPIKWRSGNRKWHIVWSHNTNTMVLDWDESGIEYAKWYFDTREHAEQIVKEFEDDLIWYFTEFKDRMDC